MSWLTADRPLIIGHRGACADAPENTLVAFALALEQNADGIELDVQLSADGAPIIMHDATVDRTCDGVGRVADMTLAELRQLTIDNDHPVPTLDDLFALLGRRTLYNVELKALGLDDGGLAETVARCVVAHDVADCVLVSSFSPFTVRSARRPCCASAARHASSTASCGRRPITPSTRWSMRRCWPGRGGGGCASTSGRSTTRLRRGGWPASASTASSPISPASCGRPSPDPIPIVEAPNQCASK